MPVHAAGEHGKSVYHAFRLEAGLGSVENGQGVADWDLDGWIGTDEDKLWLKSEGERSNGEAEQAEFWAMYSRNIATFWDLQIGIRHDTQHQSLTYGVIGFEGLAPYHFETEAHLFISEDGDISVRLRQENDLLLTQRLIVQPYLEASLFAQDVVELDIGAGLPSAELGVQIRYEVTRGFAPYIELKYERRFGKTSAIAERNGEEKDAVVGTLGIKFLF